MRKRDVEKLALIIDQMRPTKNHAVATETWLKGRGRIMDEVIPSNRVTLFLNLCPKEKLT